MIKIRVIKIGCFQFLNPGPVILIILQRERLWLKRYSYIIPAELNIYFMLSKTQDTSLVYQGGNRKEY